MLVDDSELETKLARTLGGEQLALVLAATGGPAVTTLIKAPRREEPPSPTPQPMAS